jgi:hypothetical protein
MPVVTDVTGVADVTVVTAVTDITENRSCAAARRAAGMCLFPFLISQP